MIGEYAVLDGAPALLAAVNRRVHVGLENAASGRWSVTAANLDLHAIDLGENGDANSVADPAVRARLAVFDAVRTQVTHALGAPLTPQHVAIDSTDFSGRAGKLGLGSSAAVAGALTAALLASARARFERDRVADIAIAAHRKAQDGGSGGDVACAVYGGLIRYTRNAPVVALEWPAELAAIAVVTGTGAKTPDLVARVKAYGARDIAAYAHDIARLAGLAERASAALANTTAFVELVDDYFSALRALDRHARAGIVTARHEMLHHVAGEHGGVFKSSGAGGGDVGLAFAHRDRAAELARSLVEAGAEIVDLAFGAPGVRIEPSDD